MGCIQFNEKLVSRPKIGFETKAIGFCKRAVDVFVLKFFIKFFNAKEYDSQTFDWPDKFNDIQS